MVYFDEKAILAKLDVLETAIKAITPKETPHEYKALGDDPKPTAIFCPHCGDIKKV